MKKVTFIIGAMLSISSASFSQDSVSDYTDGEIIELTNYIANLKVQNSSITELNYNRIPENKIKISGNILTDLININKDKEVVRLVNYITYLTKTDSTAETAIVRGQYESIALIILNENIKQQLVQEQTKTEQGIANASLRQ